MSRQQARPEGLLGWWAAWRMEREGQALNALTLELLELEGTCQMLELGFGPGWALRQAAARLPQGWLAGVDHAPDMVAWTSRRLRALVDAGRVELRCADFHSLPYPDARFDRVFTVNTVYFWSDPARTLAEAHRVLRPGGMLAIGFHARPLAVPREDSLVSRLEAQLRQAGFPAPRAVERPAGSKRDYCLIARKETAAP